MALTLERTTGPIAAALTVLREELGGALVLPGDPGYDQARSTHFINIDRRPDAIVRAASTRDVVLAVDFARERGLSLAVRSGGHSPAGHGTSDGGLVLDLSGMKEIDIDPEARIASVQPGVTSGDLAPRAQEYGLALSTGDTASVGLGGLTLGGGIGFLVRKYGLTIDSLLEVELVTASGLVVRASAGENADLFWAVRGGGGNFGVVTRFTFRLQPVGTILGGAVLLPATPEALRGFAAYALQAPEELTTIGVVMQAPPAPFVPAKVQGQLSLAILVCYAGDPAEGEGVIAPLRALATPLAEAIAPMPYPALFQLTAEASQRHAASVRSLFLDELGEPETAAILEHACRFSSPHALIQIRPLGGALARVAPEATAFSHRDKPFLVASLNVWLEGDAAAEARNEAWSDSFWAALQPVEAGAYVNFLGDEGEARVCDAYAPATLARLAAIKRRYDPANFFHLNQNIPPAR